METLTRPSLITTRIASRPVVERPGWIPANIRSGWDENPYAYQTEEELMPAGGLHGQKLAYIMELLRYGLEEQGLMLLLDTFLLYRDEQNVKQRIAPDLLLMPFRDSPPSAYDLDHEPPPELVVEVTSPKSRTNDLERKASFYFRLGISAYLAIDAVTSGGKPRKQINLRFWRQVDGERIEIPLDPLVGCTIPELGFRVRAIRQQLEFTNLRTGEVTRDQGMLIKALKEEQEAHRVSQQVLRTSQQALRAEQQALRTSQQALRAEQQKRIETEQENARLREELRRLRGQE